MWTLGLDAFNCQVANTAKRGVDHLLLLASISQRIRVQLLGNQKLSQGLNLYILKEVNMVKLKNSGLRLSAVGACAAIMIGMGGCGSTSAPEASTSGVSPEAPAAGKSPEIASGATQKIDVNKAPIAELDKLELPGTKPSLSERIQGARPYKTADDLVTKKAISQDELKLIKNLITLGEGK
jgi:DNA uptake protein ComE-like DNA-binding protein